MGKSWQFAEYRGLNDLELAMQRIAGDLPTDTGLVVGIPRSGLLAASVLALQLNVPLTDLEGLFEGRVLATGFRKLRGPELDEGTIVVVDDSVSTGQQMRLVRERLDAADLRSRIVLAAPYVTLAGRDMVDVYAEVVPQPRVFAWNLFHHPTLLTRSCLDIDGVLCRDPDPDENDDGDRYLRFLAEAKPLFLPSGPVKYLVTSRLERYRRETEAWLAEHGIVYEQLVMLDLPDAASRRASGAHARHKAEFYKQADAELFIESEHRQAVEIAARSGRQVFSIDRREMVYPRPRQAVAGAPVEFLRSTSRTPPAVTLYWETRAALARRGGRRAKEAARRSTRAIAARLRS